MTFKEVREEVVARGFDDFEQSDARVKRWVNIAYREITDAYAWPFLATSKEATMPMTISDLGHVLSVTDKSHENILIFADERELNRLNPTLDETGTAERWYRASETQIKVWPADTTSTFIVKYLKTPAELSADGDALVIPAAYQELVVDGAVLRAYKNRDNYEAAQAVRAEWREGLGRMVGQLLYPNYDGPRFVQRTGLPGDYLG